MKKRSRQMEIFDKYRGRAVRRKRQLLAIEGLLEYSTLLYIGASPDRFEMIDLFYDTGYEIDILEVHKPNVEALRKINEENRIFNRIIHGDVRTIERHLVHRYDVTFFWHGLEHIEAKTHKPVIAKLEDWTKYLLIFGQPWGDYPQGPVKGNPHECHISALEPEFFKNLGFRTSIVGRRPGRRSNLVAWKRLKNEIEAL